MSLKPGSWLSGPVLLLAAAMVLSFPAPGSGKEKAKKKSGIKGRIVMKSTGEPVHKGYVYAYVGKISTRAAQMGIIGITDWVSHGSAEDGTYKLDLPPGELAQSYVKVFGPFFREAGLHKSYLLYVF